MACFACVVFVWDHILKAMDRVTVANYCLGLLCLLLLQGVLNVEGRSIYKPGKCAMWYCFRSV